MRERREHETRKIVTNAGCCNLWTKLESFLHSPVKEEEAKKKFHNANIRSPKSVSFPKNISGIIWFASCKKKLPFPSKNDKNERILWRDKRVREREREQQAGTTITKAWFNGTMLALVTAYGTGRDLELFGSFIFSVFHHWLCQISLLLTQSFTYSVRFVYSY